MKPKLLIVDDDEEIRTQMKWALAKDYDVIMAGDRLSALEAFRSARPPVVLLDLGLPPNPGTPEEGLKTLAELLAADSLTKVIVITGQGEKQIALQAIGAGAYDFQNKPAEMDELQLTLTRCFHFALLEREYRDIQQGLTGTAFEGIVGANKKMQEIFGAVRKVAMSDAPVLILGESGTGKELVARAVHNKSVRGKGPFVAINCSAIPETLMESELFGHEKGSFTGAHAQRKGRIETAEGGTLFLDEIGEIPLAVQVKLLRFLQEQRIERVGGRGEIEVDARVIAATNADLTKAMAAGAFREDLFYRLAVVRIDLPPLRDRQDDVMLLAQTFLKTYSTQCGKTGLAFTPQAVRAIQRYGWPGNVRELQNRVRRAIIMCGGKRLGIEDLELSATGEDKPARSLRDARESLEREMVERALQKHAGKVAAAATELDISRPTLYELMDKLGIKRTE